MTLLLIFGYLTFTIVMLYLMISPFLGGRRANARAEHLDDEVRELEQLLARRGVLLNALRELEFEFETGKSAEADYFGYKRRYEREAVAIMRRLDDLHGGRGWEEKIDAELEARLGRPPRRKAEAGVDDASDSAETPAAEEASTPVAEEASMTVDEDSEPSDPGLLCSGCGRELAPDDVFCSRCGTQVSAPSAVPDEQPSSKQGANP